MIPVKTSSVFKNRWMALLWAGGILWFAYDFAGSQPQDQNASANSAEQTGATGAAISNADTNKLAQELNAF